jgi:hypothetical protein
MAAGNTVDSMAKNPAVEEVSGDDTQVQYEQIEITDIRRLPKRNWHLCNNSFLVHGFFNYHHLILKTVQTGDQIQRFLGVPGIYEQRERMMALLFGFPEFEAASSPSAASAQASDNGTFGYWMCELYEPA